MKRERFTSGIYVFLGYVIWFIGVPCVGYYIFMRFVIYLSIHLLIYFLYFIFHIFLFLIIFFFYLIQGRLLSHLFLFCFCLYLHSFLSSLPLSSLALFSRSLFPLFSFLVSCLFFLFISPCFPLTWFSLFLYHCFVSFPFY